MISVMFFKFIGSDSIPDYLKNKRDRLIKLISFFIKVSTQPFVHLKTLTELKI